MTIPAIAAATAFTAGSLLSRPKTPAPVVVPPPPPAASPATLASAANATKSKSAAAGAAATASGTVGAGGPQGLQAPPQTANLTLLGGTK